MLKQTKHTITLVLQIISNYYIVPFVIGITIFYLLGAFISVSFDIGYWHILTRISFSILSLLYMSFLLFVKIKSVK